MTAGDFWHWRGVSACVSGAGLLRCRMNAFELDEAQQRPVASMPTVLRVGPYRFFFYSGDSHEPPHVHVERDESVAKYWLNPVRLARSGGFGRAEMRDVGRLVAEHQSELLEAWNEYFGD